MTAVARVGADGVFLQVEEIAEDATLGSDQVAVLPPDPDAPKGAWVLRAGEWKRRAALLDERDVYVRMVELSEADPVTERHLLDITECDLPANEYRWVRNKDGALVGPFEALPVGQRAKPGRPTLEQALVFVLLKQAQKATDLATASAIELAWLDDAVRSSDFKTLRRRPEVIAYAAARGLTLED